MSLLDSYLDGRGGREMVILQGVGREQVIRHGMIVFSESGLENSLKPQYDELKRVIKNIVPGQVLYFDHVFDHFGEKPFLRSDLMRELVKSRKCTLIFGVKYLKQVPFYWMADGLVYAKKYNPRDFRLAYYGFFENRMSFMEFRRRYLEDGLVMT